MKKTTASKLPKPSASPTNPLAEAFPGGFTVRDQANALTAFAFRNGLLENLHAGKSSPLTDDPGLSRITDAEMKALMIEASTKLARLLEMRETDPEKYNTFIRGYGLAYCRFWNRK